jgi:hypothetical protein
MIECVGIYDSYRNYNAFCGHSFGRPLGIVEFWEIDDFVKSLKTSFGVIAAKVGIQCFQIVLDVCLRRHDGIWDLLRVCQY